MVIDSTLDRIKAESTIDIFNFVAYLRTRRTAMVQTEVRNTSFFYSDENLRPRLCQGLRFSCKDRMFKVNNLLIIWFFALFFAAP